MVVNDRICHYQMISFNPFSMSSRDKPDKESNEEGDSCPMTVPWTVHATVSFPSVRTRDENLQEPWAEVHEWQQRWL